MRKNIFEILSSKTDMDGDTYRLITMANEEKTLYYKREDYSIFEFVDKFCFEEWKYRGRYINVDDFLEALEFYNLEDTAKYNLEDHLTLIELIYNFWNLANNMFNEKDFIGNLKWCGNFYHLKDVMDDILEEYNHSIYINEDTDQIIVVANKEEATAVAEILRQDLALDVIKYNHHSLKGDIAMKKTILLRLGAELEPQRQTLINKDKDLESNIFFMLNNLNLRHNNTVEGDKWYKKKVAEMTSEELESWYDELYQLMLIGFLTIDNIERSDRVNQLKKEINT